MHSTIAFSTLLVAASSVLALPQGFSSAPVASASASASFSASSVSASASASASSVASFSGYGDNSVTVILQNQAIELGSQTTFKNADKKQTKSPVGSTGPFETIEINLGADVANTALRCAALDMNGNPLIARRGANTDTTFSDADKGAWTFLEPVEVHSIVCDPAFVAVAAGSYDVRVTLADSAEDLATQTALSGVVRDVQVPVGSSGPFDSVTIDVGPLVDPALRCKVKNVHGRAIVATRGENIDTTFSDADKGAWTFNKRSSVSVIVCDAKFVAAPQQ